MISSGEKEDKMQTGEHQVAALPDPCTDVPAPQHPGVIQPLQSSEAPHLEPLTVLA